MTNSNNSHIHRSAYNSKANGRCNGNRAWLMRAIGLAFLLILVRPAEAYAYVDPSTTSYFLQWLLAGILGAAFALRMYWRNLRVYFSKRFSKNDDSESDMEEPKP